MLLVKNVHVFSPENLGVNDILVVGGKIEKIAQDIQIHMDGIEIVDGTGKYAVPGFIDPHVHITGGGGEGGFHTRAPEIMLSTFVKAGITTVVGLLGTDGVTRSVESLYSKAKALNNEGITAYALAGSYRVPTVTVTGDVEKDIIFVNECIGAKIAISDHRSSMITDEELARLASEVRVAGMISGKSGVLTVHMGDGSEGLEPIYRVLKKTTLPITLFRPTHLNRSASLLMSSLDYAKKGGYVDLTCGDYLEYRPYEVIDMAIESGVPLDRFTFSSDGGGSWSHYDEVGNLIEMGVSGVKSLHEEIIALIEQSGFSLDNALPFITSNTAKALGFEGKGVIRQGVDADLNLLDSNYDIESVIAGGKFFLKNYQLVISGTYES